MGVQDTCDKVVQFSLFFLGLWTPVSLFLASGLWPGTSLNFQRHCRVNKLTRTRSAQRIRAEFQNTEVFMPILLT
jgi:hypothetical protein